MRISVINLTHGLLADQDVLLAIRAINRQISEDFASYWNMQGQLRLEGNSSKRPNIDNPQDMQGEAIIYLWDKSDIPDALGYHEANYRGIPYGFVFVDIATEIGENWTVTLSHEALELIGDRQANKLTRGPDPRDKRRIVYHWHEMCDAVQDETYLIDSIEVSNFVLPLYFTEDAEPGSRNDFLGTQYTLGNNLPSQSLRSFGINPGGYIGFYDPKTNTHVTEMGPDISDAAFIENERIPRAEFRRMRKNKARMARRGNRYSEMGLQTEASPKITQLIAGKEITLKDRGIAIRCQSHNLSIQTNTPALVEEQRKGRGYYAYDIYSDAEKVNRNLVSDDFEEIDALEIDPVPIKSSIESPQVEFEIAHNKNEAVIAIVEINGVMLWHQASAQKPGSSLFKVKMQTIDASAYDQSITENNIARRAFILKGLKTVVRFVKHKFVDSMKDLISNNLLKYLSEQIEKQAFRKDSPA